MREVEVKILEINTEEVIQKLQKFGAEKTFEGPIEAFYYDFENKSLSQKDIVVRLRKRGELSELAVKEKISQKKAKIMDELEVIVSDFNSMYQILHKIGLRQVKSGKKYRVSYLLSPVHFDIDTIPGIPTFMEIEAPTLDEVKVYVEKLGYTMNDAKPWSGKDLLRHYKKE